jgi:hypothetical protein
MDINKRMELKGRAVQPTDQTPWHKNTCDDMTAKMEVFTAVLKTEIAARRLLQSLPTFRTIVTIQQYFLDGRVLKL